MSDRRAIPSFDDLVAPTTPREFFERHFDRSPHHGRGERDRFAGVLEPLDWTTAVATSQHVHASHVDARGRQHSVETAAAGATALIASRTICADVSHVHGVADLLDGFRRELHLTGGACIAKLYASPDGGGFTMHSDAFHVFVLQLSGEKRWHVSRSPHTPAPLTGWVVGPDGPPTPELPAGFDRALLDHAGMVSPPSSDELTTFVLTPGDCLYVPAGAWHRAEANGTSVALSISPPRSMPVRTVLSALEDALLSDPDWRRDLLITADGLPIPGIEERFQTLLDDLRTRVGALDARSLYRRWRAQVERERGAVDSVASHEPLAREDALVVTGDVRFVRAPSDDARGDALYLYGAGAEWCFPLDAEPFLQALARIDAFVAAEALDWDRSLDWSDVEELLAHLLEARIVGRRA